MNLSEDQKQSLITSLLGFVRHVSFQGGAMPGEVEILPEIVKLLLGIPIVFDWAMTEGEDCEETPEIDESQKSENSGYCYSCECPHHRCLVQEK